MPETEVNVETLHSLCWRIDSNFGEEPGHLEPRVHRRISRAPINTPQ